MTLRSALRLSLVFAVVAVALAASNDGGKSITVKGYVLDSACAFTKGLKKPISGECAAILSSPARRRVPILSAWAIRSRSTISSRTAAPAAQAIGFAS